jgi:hypothetical protein
MRKTIFFLFLGIILTMNARAQKDPSTINSSGGSATYKTVTYDWSVGEMAAIETFSTTSLIITQGFLQPAILKVDHFDQSITDHQKIVVYPDPGKQTCIIETKFAKHGKLNYQLIDLNGRIFLKKETNLKEMISKESINLSNYPKGIYLLRVSFTSKDETISQTFKIQK